MRFTYLVGNILTLTLMASASSLAASDPLAELMGSDDGRSVEEKIYQLWVEAEGKIPSLPEAMGGDAIEKWVGLDVVNMGTKERWRIGNSSNDYGVADKHQKLVLTLAQVAALKIGNIEIKPAIPYGFVLRSDNFTGDLDPRNTFAGRIGRDLYWNIPQYEDRADRGTPNPSYAVRKAKRTSSGLLVKDLESSPVLQPIEYRQLEDDVLVGVRKANTEGQPCLHSKAIETKEMREVEVDGSFFGIPTKTREMREVTTVRWEDAPDYGVPGVCEVHYLLKAQD